MTTNGAHRSTGPLRTTTISGLALDWDERVLAPRPWTALQARWAAELSPTLGPGPVLELCCGVGHIGLLAVRGAGRAGVLVDADPHACALARHNARRAGLGTRVQVLEHRLDGGAVPSVTNDVPLVLADPPYVPADEAAELHDDPDHAVLGGSDGLRIVPTVLRTAAAHLARHGCCLLQVRGRAQADSVARRLRDDWADIGLVACGVRQHDDERAVLLLMRTDPLG